MSDSKGWLEVIKPHLLDQLNQAFPDPSSFTNDGDFTYAAKVTSVYKKVIAELLGWVDQEITMAKTLRLKEKANVPDPFAIGRE